ncbi:protein SCAI [Achroia grisella]|uniref:protein SCAI n=1 Tax=Achroia grisella TaxID=688607 RepID=UPI0027D2F49B|nr:protein SCAI [Achroia grisella]
MENMNPLDEHERKVIIEFCHLLEKSKQLFNGLRELPQYGHKQWHSYFGRTFDVYTKLWKFQQKHRCILDSKYGLKRWQIGEIASKIGQLYYHFYLRTSNTGYLNEAYSFYYAIRGRCYYTKASKEDKCELMVKKLRYYARFIVVCLLLKKLKLVRDLIKELDRQIIDYGITYDPDDQMEWALVVDEVKAFIQMEPVITVLHPDNYPVTLSHRLSPLTTPPVERNSNMSLVLHEILIIGSNSQQVKFSELTIDMYRMLQTLEREATGEIHQIYDDSPRQKFTSTPNAPNNKGYYLENGRNKPLNPHKYLLYKPSPSQLLVYLASGCLDLPLYGALLIYISSDGQIVQPPKNSEDGGYDAGGLITTSKNDIYRESNRDSKAPTTTKHKESHCLHPGDLFPFTRRPLFLIIDSDNSYVFQNLPQLFGQPLVVLMSPAEFPAPFRDRGERGSLFTLFLHSPLSAFCYFCQIHELHLVHWDRAQNYIDTFMAEASQLVTRSRLGNRYMPFMGDDFLRLLVLRFIFCEVIIRTHRAFEHHPCHTRAAPPLPEELLGHPALFHIVMDLASHLQVRHHFQDPNAPAAPPANRE